MTSPVSKQLLRQIIQSIKTAAYSIKTGLIVSRHENTHQLQTQNSNIAPK